MRARGTTPPAVRVAALGGVLGPVAFVAAWTAGAIVTDDPYSSVDDAMSRLAAVGADSRALMTAGFVCFGVGLPVYAWALRAVVPGRAWIAAAATGLATLAVAVAPLDRSAAVDRWHGVFATVGYVTLTATPLLAAGPLNRQGHRALALLGAVAAAVAAGSLVLTLTPLPRGLFQRLGLSAADVWIVASALAIAAGRAAP